MIQTNCHYAKSYTLGEEEYRQITYSENWPSSLQMGSCRDKHDRNRDRNRYHVIRERAEPTASSQQAQAPKCGTHTPTLIPIPSLVAKGASGETCERAARARARYAVRIYLSNNTPPKRVIPEPTPVRKCTG